MTILNGMCETAFKKIPSGVFEALMILAVIGGCFLLWNHRKGRNVLYWILAFSVVFMVLWRIGIQLVSGRYAMLLIIPFIPITVSAMSEAARMLPEKFRRVAFLGGMIILTSIFAGKALHTNPYANFIPAMCGKVKARPDAKDASVLELVGDAKRIEYYSGMKVCSMEPEGKVIPPEQLKKILTGPGVPSGKVFVFLNEYKSGGRITAESLGFKQGNWTFVASSYRNNRKKLSLSVYCYHPGEKAKRSL